MIVFQYARHDIPANPQVDISDACNPCPDGKTKITIGDRLHPNYLYTHNNFYTCPYGNSPDFTQLTAPHNSEVGRCIDYASEMSITAAECVRTKSEEDLRREGHRECASARLEGCGVGQYRYYQGHLNVEEYLEAGMCICWDSCDCSKMCTRYGDLICPCSKYIELHQH